MLFSSSTFIYLFLPAVLIAYYAIFKNYRTLSNIFLFAASILFYGWGEPKFVFVMLVSIVVNWFFGLMVHRAKERSNRTMAMLIIAATCLFDLGLLFVFKYLNFAESVFCSLLGISPRIKEIVLPIGISFFTFQAMSYVLDVYRDRGQVQKNILNVGLYIAFFPQLIAGPIVRYETVALEINSRKESFDDFFNGFARFVVGLSKKILLANAFGIIADKVFDMSFAGDTISVGTAWLGALAYTFQIFFDFSGYSDMAIGLGRMFGFHFLENFDYPYISASVTEFWRRWHMSLGSWFRDYVYIPLGGSRVGKKRLVFNLFVVWFLTGFWHGADWSFILWGLMYFVLLSFEKLTGLNKHSSGISQIFGRVYTLFFVIIGWVLFRSVNTSSAIRYMACMFGVGNTFSDGFFVGYFRQYAVMLVLGVVCSIPLFKYLWAKIPKNIFTDILHIVCLTGLFVLCISSMVSSSYNPFIYFNF